jgi:hypothetical protein
MIYNLYFHPLARFPGPFWARTTLFWRFWHDLTGLSHWTIQDCHRKYGDVFRVGPNELSFASVQAYKDIYAAKGPRPMKSEFYDMLGTGFSESCVVTERDHKRALQKRALFMSALSSKALMEQEVVIQRCIDSFVEKLGKLGGGPGGLDLTKWYMMLSFDIGGEMAFGESFGCVETGMYRCPIRARQIWPLKGRADRPHQRRRTTGLRLFSHICTPFPSWTTYGACHWWKRQPG